MVDPSTARRAVSEEVADAMKHVVTGLERVRENPSPEAIGNAQSWVRLILATQLVPSVMAATCALFVSECADWSEIVNTVAPKLLDDFGDEPLSLDGDFLEEIGKSLDPEKWSLLSQNLGDQTGIQRLAQGSFDATLSALLD